MLRDGSRNGVDPRLDMVYVMMEQTQNERARVRVAFKKLVYDAFAALPADCGLACALRADISAFVQP